MLLCKGLVFLFLFIIVIVIVISYYIFIYFIIHVTFYGLKSNQKAFAPPKIIRMTVSNSYSTCCACGTRLLRKLKQSSAMLQVLFDWKSASYFWKVAARLKFVV